MARIGLRNCDMKYYKAINDKNMIFVDRTKALAFTKDELFTEREVYWFFGCRFA